MSLFVKLCGLRSEADLEAAVEAGADAVGFVLTPSPRRITVEMAGRLMRMLPDSVLGVAVFHQPSSSLLSRTMETVVPDLLQAEPAYLEGVPTALRLPVVVEGSTLRSDFELALRDSGRRMVLVDRSARGGTGERTSWSLLSELPRRDRLIVAGGLGPGNVADAVRLIGPLGVDVSSGIEKSPGEKDPAMMRAFVAAARSVSSDVPSTGSMGYRPVMERNLE
ncbi:MAG: phosphoribosylanthranilate isomerase [Acidimicrobiia bacterium]